MLKPNKQECVHMHVCGGKGGGACGNPALKRMPKTEQTSAESGERQGHKPEGILSDIALRCKAGDGPHADLNAVVELLASHVPHALVGHRLRFGL